MSVGGNTLRPRITLLVESGANQFDPVKFRYIESLAQRADDLRGMVRDIVERKALEALGDYQSRFDQARADASSVLAGIIEGFPSCEKTARSLFESGDFRALKRLKSRLERDARRPSLRALREAIGQLDIEGDAVGQQMSFDALLAKHEAEVVQECGGVREESSDENSHELKSFKLFKDTWARLHSERVVTQAIQSKPSNPGPLNPQMLAIKSLSTMRELSPNYLNRFVSYVDTLLWLERASAGLITETTSASGKGQKRKAKAKSRPGKRVGKRS